MPTFNTPRGPIYFEQRGSRADPPILMIHGLGCQTVHWPESLIEGLKSEGFRVVLMDNRDAGLSFGVEQSTPEIGQLIQAMNDPSIVEPPYRLADMAEDVVHLLDHLGQSGAHLVGVSMGGMIAQYVALNHEKRVFSLSLLMSSTGNPKIPDPAPEIIGALGATVASPTREDSINASRAANKMFGGPHFDSSTVGIGRFVETAYDRASRPDGVLRQLGAILGDGDRRSRLSKLQVPALMIHGDHDPLVDKFGSIDLAETIPNSRLVIIEKLGHDLPEPLIPRILAEIVAHIRSHPSAR